MADIVIRKMDMPRFCCECPLKESMYDVGFICLPRKEPIKVNLYKGRDDACPIVPLPEGHGRLGDLDALDRAFTDLRFNADGTLAHWDDRRNWCLHGEEIERLIGEAPTIVQAEGELRNDS